MRKANGIGKTFGKVFTYLLVVLLVLGFAGGASYLLFREQGVTFFVELNGKKHFANSDEKIWLPSSNTPYSFTVKSLTGKPVDYSVSVLSNPDYNFTFVHDGEPKKFHGTDETLNDYSEVFGLQTTAENFTLIVPPGWTVQSAVETQYGGKIDLLNPLESNQFYFVIAVTVEDSKVLLRFDMDSFNIKLNFPQIIF